MHHFILILSCLFWPFKYSGRRNRRLKEGKRLKLNKRGYTPDTVIKVKSVKVNNGSFHRQRAKKAKARLAPRPRPPVETSGDVIKQYYYQRFLEKIK